MDNGPFCVFFQFWLCSHTPGKVKVVVYTYTEIDFAVWWLFFQELVIFQQLKCSLEGGHYFQTVFLLRMSDLMRNVDLKCYGYIKGT